MDYDHHDKVNGPEEQSVLADIHSAAEADYIPPMTGVPRTENWREVVEDRGRARWMLGFLLVRQRAKERCATYIEPKGNSRILEEKLSNGNDV